MKPQLAPMPHEAVATAFGASPLEVTVVSLGPFRTRLPCGAVINKPTQLGLMCPRLFAPHCTNSSACDTAHAISIYVANVFASPKRTR